jgi:hypothetical protein
MICLRCGYCCIEYVVGIVNNPELGISEGNILPKTSGEKCKHLIGAAPGEYSCAIHNYTWYEETPCAEFTQVGKPDSPCRRGKQILKKMQHTIPVDLMRVMSEKYPNAWQDYAKFRARKGSPDFDDWPSWCWVPLHAAYAIVSGGSSKVPDELLDDIPILGAVATWRQTQGIYRIDIDLAEELLEAPISGPIPSEVLFRLPEWCVYVELGEEFSFFANLDWDVGQQHAELAVVLLGNGKPVHLVAHLYPKATIEEMVIGTEREIEDRGLGVLTDAVKSARGYVVNALRSVVSILLYLCSEQPDIIDHAGKRRKPGPPPPVSTATGPKFFPPANPTQWDVGYKVGAVLRSHREAESIRGEGTHASPRPHVRRAHWHSYWTGPRDDPKKQAIVLKWIHPLLVGGDKIIPTIYQVKKDPP